MNKTTIRETPADASGADLIDSVPIAELMPPVKDPRAFVPKELPTAAPVSEEILSVTGLEDESPVAPPVEKGPFIILIQHKTKKTLHAVTAPKKGPGVLATFTTRKQAQDVQTKTEACQKNWSTVLSVLSVILFTCIQAFSATWDFSTAQNPSLSETGQLASIVGDWSTNGFWSLGNLQATLPAGNQITVTTVEWYNGGTYAEFANLQIPGFTSTSSTVRLLADGWYQKTELFTGKYSASPTLFLSGTTLLNSLVVDGTGAAPTKKSKTH